MNDGQGNGHHVVFENVICAIQILPSFGAVFSQAYSAQFHFADIFDQVGKKKEYMDHVRIVSGFSKTR